MFPSQNEQYFFPSEWTMFPKCFLFGTSVLGFTYVMFSWPAGTVPTASEILRKIQEEFKGLVKSWNFVGLLKTREKIKYPNISPSFRFIVFHVRPKVLKSLPSWAWNKAYGSHLNNQNIHGIFLKIPKLNTFEFCGSWKVETLYWFWL